MVAASTPSPRTTLHRSLSDELLRGIRSGEYPVGSNLPTEAVLREKFGVSRHTVREATRRLADLGLVVRKPRTGTTVVRQHAEPQFGLALESMDQLVHYLETTALHVHRVTHAIAALPADLKLDGKPADWFRVSTFRCMPGSDRPISWTELYIRREYDAVLPHIGREPGGVFPLFERLFDDTVETIDMELSAATFPAAIAKRLGFAKGDPALLIVRRFRNAAGKLLEVSVSHYPPFRFRYVSTLKRVQGRYRNAS